MRKLLSAAPCLLVALVLLFILPARTLVVIARHGGGMTATLNGDVNGDSDRDLSDAIYLLRWLFQGGPEPVACAQAPPPPSRGWPPRPQDVVNVDASRVKTSQEDGTLTLFEVPKDKWLVVTDVSAFDSASTDISTVISTASIELVEELEGKLIVKRGGAFTGTHTSPKNFIRYTGGSSREIITAFPVGFALTAGPYASSVGLTFRPGSLVVLKSSPGSLLSFTLGGYLAEP